MINVNKDRLLRQFVELVAIDSPSHHERKIADRLKEIFKEMDIALEEDETHLPFGYETGNLFGRVDGDKDREPLLFCCHMDTVEPSCGKRAIIHEDGTITSDGTTVLGADDLAGLSCIIEAVRTIREKGLKHCPLEILFTHSEETYGQGSDNFDYSKVLSKTAYVADIDKPMGYASLQEPSLISYEVIIHGKSAHAGFAPEEGINAIACAAKIIAGLKQGRIGDDTVANVGVIQGGKATNIVSEEVRFKGEVRSYDDAKAMDLLRQIEDRVNEVCAEYKAVPEFHYTKHLTAYKIPEDSEVVRYYEEKARSVGLEPVLTKTFGGSDNNMFCRNGIKGIVIASAMHACHTVREYTTIEELNKLAELMTALMCG